jgi:PAS domain S-box-containing protein
MPFHALRIRTSLKNRIMLLVSGLVLAGIWGLAVPLVALLRADLEESIADNLATTVDYAAAHIDQEMQLRIDALVETAAVIATGMAAGPPDVQRLLEHRHASPTIFPGGLVVVDRQGVAIADFPPRPGRRGARFSDLDYFRAVMTGGKPAIGAPSGGDEAKRWTVAHIGVPIRSAAGDMAGVLAAPAHLQDDDLLGVLEEIKLGEAGDFVVASPRDHLVVGATDRARILQPLPAPGADPLWDRRIREGFQGAAITMNPAGVEVLQVGSTMKTTGWMILASIPTAEAFAPIAGLTRQLYGGALGMAALIALLLHFALRRQLAPLIEAGKAMRRMSESQEPFAPIAVGREDEIGFLTRSFNRLVADRNRLDASLRQSEKRFRDIVNSIDGIVWEADAATLTYTYVSDQAERLLGYPVEDWKRPGFWFEHLHPQDKGWVTAYCAARTAKLQAHDCEYRFIARDGSVVWLHDMVTVVGEGGKPRWLRGIMVDSTARKRAERELLLAKAEAERANNAKSRFLAAASHDLRQPLAALNLYVGMLGFKLAPGDAVLSKNMADCVASLSEMLNDLLDLSKLEAGVVTPEVSDFSLAKVLASVVATHAPEAQANGLALRCVPSELTARTDPVLFGRVLGNFVANAVRYTKTGGVLVGCRRSHGRTWVEVWDTGIGIPANKTAEIFEEFRQLGNDARDRSKGSGLGLAIVTKAAALLGLRIRVRSRPGKGSMFAVEVPLGQTACAEQPRQFTHRPLRIALVEDDVLVVEALIHALAALGHQVVAAATSGELLAGLGRQAPDIVISDYRLADGETGFDAIMAVRTAFGDAVPALLMTGDTDPQLIRRMADRGIRVQHKPVELDALQTCIAELTGVATPARSSAVLGEVP